LVGGQEIWNIGIEKWDYRSGGHGKTRNKRSRFLGQEQKVGGLRTKREQRRHTLIRMRDDPPSPQETPLAQVTLKQSDGRGPDKISSIRILKAAQGGFEGTEKNRRFKKLADPVQSAGQKRI